MKEFTVEFGKYKGKTLVEIAKDDLGYITWFAKNYQQGTYVGYGGKTYDCKPTDAQKEMIKEAKRLSEIGKEIRIKEYQEESNRLGEFSEFVGTLNSRQEFEVEFIKVQQFPQYDYFLYTFQDLKRNVITMYSLNFNPLKNTIYKLKGTPKKHKEYNGNKSTHINRVSLVQVLQEAA